MAKISKMSKEEILELLCDGAFFWPISRLSDRDINAAKGRVLRRKADDAFKRWNQFQEIKWPNRDGMTDLEYVDETFRCLNLLKEKESIFKRYMGLDDRASKLEFGDVQVPDVTD